MKCISHFQHPDRFYIFIALLCVAAVFPQPAECAPPAESHTLIGVIWNSRVPQTYATDYLSSVARKHKINHPMLGENYTNHITNVVRPAEKKGVSPNRGFAYFLRNQFPPSFLTVGFRTVADQAEFEAAVQQDKKLQPGQFVTVEGSGDKFTLNVIVNNAMMPTFYRLHNGVMFRAQDNNLFTMDLPDADAFVMPAEEKTRDLIARFDFDRIPPLLRDIPLMMVRVNAQQQMADENELRAEFYKAALEYGLSIAKTMFDGTRKGTLAMTLFHDGRPADLVIDLEIRDDSALAASIARMTTSERRLGMADDGPLCTLALQSGPSEELCAALSSGAKLLRTSTEGDANVEQLVAFLETLAQKPSQIDGYASLGIDPSGQFAIYGAISAVDAGLVSSQDAISIEFPTDWFKALEVPAAAAPLLPSKLTLRVDNSLVWFCVGRSRSADKLNAVIASHKSSKPLPSHHFLTADLQAEPWVSDRQAKREAMASLEQAVSAETVKGRYRSFLDETLNRNGKAHLSIVVDKQAPGHVQLKASVGDGLARFAAARYLQREHVQLEEQIEEHKGETGAKPRKSNFWLLLFGNLGLLAVVIVVPRLRRKS